MKDRPKATPHEKKAYSGQENKIAHAAELAMRSKAEIKRETRSP